jgi:hypothetical protein
MNIINIIMTVKRVITLGCGVSFSQILQMQARQVFFLEWSPVRGTNNRLGWQLLVLMN